MKGFVDVRRRGAGHIHLPQYRPEHSCMITTSGNRCLSSYTSALARCRTSTANGPWPVGVNHNFNRIHLRSLIRPRSVVAAHESHETNHSLRSNLINKRACFALDCSSRAAILRLQRASPWFQPQDKTTDLLLAGRFFCKPDGFPKTPRSVPSFRAHPPAGIPCTVPVRSTYPPAHNPPRFRTLSPDDPTCPGANL